MLKRLAVSTALAVLCVFLAAGTAASAHGRVSRTLWASPAGGAGSCARFSPCSLAGAVASSVDGDSVIALPGVYHGGVVVDKRVSLRGFGAVIDATSAPNGNGVQIVGPGGSGSSVEGFKIENATFEGILVGTAPVAPSTNDGTPVTSGQPVSDVRIDHNVIVHNDAGFGSTAGQCFSTPQAPGDCGEAIHLVAVTDSVVADNYVTNNAGGILLTDEFGPTSDNAVRNNFSAHNDTDCGITLAGHNPAAVDPKTGQPTGAAGVFDNLIEGNVSIDNGVAGQGAGILMGGGAPFAGVYGNVIRGNFTRGNGLAGVTIHQHLIGDLNGNVVEDNVLSHDNLDGDFDFAAAADSQTTGILVASGSPPGPALPPPLVPGPIKNTVIRGNRIFDDAVGIWTLGVDPGTTTISHNFFGPGVTPVVTN
ncbi:MAG: right-handed parallel beta-helix repeat-containing protein [Solirubrobacteraceae bacterium]